MGLIVMGIYIIPSPLLPLVIGNVGIALFPCFVQSEVCRFVQKKATAIKRQEVEAHYVILFMLLNGTVVKS